MRYLVVVNSHFSRKSSSFWEKHQYYIKQVLTNHEIWIPNSEYFKLPTRASEFDVIVLIGNDSFFSRFINSVFYELTSIDKNTAIAFIPDRKNLAIPNGLGISQKLTDQCNLILRNNSILMDLVRCHYLDIKGIPRSHFIVNDAVIGVSPARLPLLLKTLAEVAKNPPILPVRNKNKLIRILSEGETVFDGGYIFAALMLGNKLTNGPKLPKRTKMRCHQHYFDYYQLNTAAEADQNKALLNLYQANDAKGNKYIFSGSYNELTIKGGGAENTIIADGMYLGRVPATFSFLPKSLRVIAPLQMAKISYPWQAAVPTPALPKPIGSGKYFKNKAS